MKKNRMFFYHLVSGYDPGRRSWQNLQPEFSFFRLRSTEQAPDAGASKAVNRSRFQPQSIRSRYCRYCSGPANNNRPDRKTDSPFRPLNWQETDLYVTVASGILMTPGQNGLEPVLNENIRALTGKQPFVKTACESDHGGGLQPEWENPHPKDRSAFAHADAVVSSARTYIYSVLPTWPRFFGRPALGQGHGNQKPENFIFATVGYR